MPKQFDFDSSDSSSDSDFDKKKKKFQDKEKFSDKEKEVPQKKKACVSVFAKTAPSKCEKSFCCILQSLQNQCVTVTLRGVTFSNAVVVSPTSTICCETSQVFGTVIQCCNGLLILAAPSTTTPPVPGCSPLPTFVAPMQTTPAAVPPLILTQSMTICTQDIAAVSPSFSTAPVSTRFPCCTFCEGSEEYRVKRRRR